MVFPRKIVFTIALLLILALRAAGATVSAPDDAGQTLTLAEPAQRIVSLAPHVTEMLYSAGAGSKIVGTVEYSDFPPAAKTIPRIGSYQQLDFERIAALRPDLIIGWASGNSPDALSQLRELGFKVYVTEPRSVEDIARNVKQLATLAGTESVARARLDKFRQGVAALRERYRNAEPVTLFYEVWNDPLMTLNGDHLFSDLARLCSGRNVFADLPALAPQIGIESVLAANPEVIIASGADGKRPAWLDDWKRWPSLKAVKEGHLYFVPPDLIQRHTLRVLEGATILCGHLEKARE